MERAPESKRSSHSKQALSGPHSQQQTNQQSFPQPYQQQYPYQHQPQQTYPETPQMDQQMCQSRQKPQMYQQTQQQWAVNFKPCNDRFMGCSCRVAANVFAIAVLIVSAIHGGLNIYVMSKSYGNLGYYIDLALVLLQIVGSVMVVLAYFNDSSCLYISGEVVSLVHYGAVLLIGLWLCVANRFGTLLVIGVIFVPALIITLLIMLVISSVRCVKVLNAEELRLQNIGFGVPGEYASAQMYQQQSLANQQLNPSSKKHEDRYRCGCSCLVDAFSQCRSTWRGNLCTRGSTIECNLDRTGTRLSINSGNRAIDGYRSSFWNFTCLYTASIVLNASFSSIWCIKV
uniref:Tetraspanin n=1 Tax=Ditylenchus dipsaci TaxID=166011 RepID=A0A915DIW4_9BILA